MFTAFVSLFSVEALDTRLGPVEDAKKRDVIISRAGKPKWKTPEFYLYGFIFAVAVPLMFKASFDVSRTDNPNYVLYSNRLQQGWMFGRKVDNSDAQYSTFRNNFPLLTAVVAAHVTLRYLYRKLVPDQSRDRRITFDVVFSVVYLLIMHGVSFFKIAAILITNYYISRIGEENRKLAYWLTWVFGVSILFANELCAGYRFGAIHPSIAWLDEYPGIVKRWDVTFNFTMLRMVSFNVDYFKALASPLSPASKKLDDIKQSSQITERMRIDTPRPSEDYNWKNYYAYTTYSPLYVSGPIITFNDFMYQSERTLPSIDLTRTCVYAFRFVVCLLTMEFLLHFCYVVAISQTKAWHGDTPMQISMIALFNLNVIWLKLLLPWRMFRLWSLLDGIDPPENMIRCVNNNYSAMSFWRAWHRSFYRWVIRYVYVPLGGSKRPIFNSLVVFTFVALWHDIQLRLLIWGWLIVFFIIPELASSLLFPAKKWGHLPIYRHLCALGGVANIWMMMIANLIGFCVGVDGMRDMLHDMFATVVGIKYVIVSSACLFVGVQAMFEFREREKRKGIDLRC